MNFYAILQEHEKVINSYINNINKDNYQEILSKIYNYVKSITNVYYNEYQMHDAYKYVRQDVIRAEDKFSYKKLLNVPIYFDMFEEKDEFVEYIVHSTRKYLINEHTFYRSNRNIKDIDFTNDCKKASEYTQELCNEYNVECYSLPIYPGYEDSALLYDGSGYHFANIIKYSNTYYLVDVTYSQFFYEKRNNLDRLGIVNMSGCNVGTFMLMTDKGKTIATILLQNGYIELNEEILKTYLDAFTISFRNGLFYEKTNDFSYTTSYLVDDYINFLQGKDNQINHEGKENLGYQKKPLKNWNLNFKV